MVRGRRRGRDSTIDAQAGSRPGASRFRGAGALAVSCWNLARKSADIRAHFCREKFPSRSKNDAPGFATPHAPSDSGAQNE